MGYSFKAIAPVTNTTHTSANIDVFTVPASHTYLLKNFEIYMVAEASTATTGKVQISDAAGTTFYDLTPAYATGATTGNTGRVTLCVPVSNADTSAAIATGTRVLTPALTNMIFEAGQKLRVVKTCAGSGAPPLSVFCSVIDFV